MLTCLDTVYDPSGHWDLIAPSLAHTDVFAPGIDEARAITGLDDVPRMAGWLRERGVGTVALKLGPAGCYVSAKGVEQHVPSLAVRAVDGTGAGDAFVAGLLYGVLNEWPLPRAARFGNVLGALVTAGLGATDGLQDLPKMLALI
jgi:sugar/nucleoside kinase (ribokinase family)